MINDALESFVFPAAPLSLVAGAGVSIPTNPIDLLGSGPGTPVTNIWGLSTLPGQADGHGVGKPRPELFVAIGTALATSNSATLNVQLQGAPDNGSNLPGTYQTFGESGPITAAQGVAGQIIARLPWLPPFPQNTRPRFIRLNFFIPSATNFTAGTIGSALVTTERDDWYAGQQPRNYSAPRFTG